MEEFGYDKQIPGGSLQPEESKKKLNHEIRSVSHGLLGYLSIFTDEMEGKLSDEDKELLSRVHYYSHKLSDLVLELLSKYNQDNNASENNDWNK